MVVNIFDFDKTIYAGDSSVDFVLYSFRHYPKTLLVIPKIILYSMKYKLGKCTKTEMKEQFFSFLQYIPNIDELLTTFWQTHKKKIKHFYALQNHQNDIIISASPEFLLKPICENLGVKALIASPVDALTGKFNGLNCHDVEKVRRFKEKYPKATVAEAYSDSLSDKPLFQLAHKAYLVKGEKRILYHDV